MHTKSLKRFLNSGHTKQWDEVHKLILAEMVEYWMSSCSVYLKRPFCLHLVSSQCALLRLQYQQPWIIFQKKSYPSRTFHVIRSLQIFSKKRMPLSTSVNQAKWLLLPAPSSQVSFCEMLTPFSR